MLQSCGTSSVRQDESSNSAVSPFSTSPKWNRQSRSKLIVVRSAAAAKLGKQQAAKRGVKRPRAAVLAVFMGRTLKLEQAWWIEERYYSQLKPRTPACSRYVGLVGRMISPPSGLPRWSECSDHWKRPPHTPFAVFFSFRGPAVGRAAEEKRTANSG